MQADSLPPCLHRRREVDLAWVARELGLLGNERRTIINKLRLLAEHNGFPLPKRPRFVGATRITGPKSICALSVWDRDPVERWLEDDRPPAESAALATIRRGAAAEEMARRALQLVAANG
jgi:hypothetical protein